jgi:hypothetical protein
MSQPIAALLSEASALMSGLDPAFRVMNEGHRRG